MIIDINTRIWESSRTFGEALQEQMRRRRTVPWERPDFSADAHHAAMEPVSKAVILGFQSEYLDVQITHEQVAGYVQRDPEKYVGFAGIDSTASRPVRSLERALGMGLLGVAVNPAAQGFHPADTRAMALYQACEAQQVPVFFGSSSLLARSAKMEFGQPYMLDEVLRTFRNLRVVIASLGHPWTEQCLALLGKHPTAYADLSDLIQRPWQLYNALLMAHQQGVTNQIVFGSGYPFSVPEQAIVTIYQVNTLVQGTHLPSVPREQLRSIVERDALACLGIGQPAQNDSADGDHGNQKDHTKNKPGATPRPTVMEDVAQ